MAWVSLTNEFSYYPLIFYFGAIFWTLGYDTIYGFQDIKDDEIIGVKSTSIKFKKNPKMFLTVCYLIFYVSIFLVGVLMSYSFYYFLFSVLIFFHLIVFQIKPLDISKPQMCLGKFKSNNFLGLLVFINILVGGNLWWKILKFLKEQLTTINGWKIEFGQCYKLGKTIFDSNYQKCLVYYSIYDVNLS